MSEQTTPNDPITLESAYAGIGGGMVRDEWKEDLQERQKIMDALIAYLPTAIKQGKAATAS